MHGGWTLGSVRRSFLGAVIRGMTHTMYELGRAVAIAYHLLYQAGLIAPAKKLLAAWNAATNNAWNRDVAGDDGSETW